MAFGQQSGPPATHRQLRELTELLEAAGHTDFRDARGPMGFTQRQAGGKFTRDEADEFIAALQEAEMAADDPPPPTRTSPPARAPRPKAKDVARTAAPRPEPEPSIIKSLDAYTDQQLAAELQRRGWVVMEP